MYALCISYQIMNAKLLVFLSFDAKSNERKWSPTKQFNIHCIYHVYTFMYIVYTMYMLLYYTVHLMDMKCICRCYKENIHYRSEVYTYVHGIHIAWIYIMYVHFPFIAYT
jgi:hypothetical protein